MSNIYDQPVLKKCPNSTNLTILSLTNLLHLVGFLILQFVGRSLIFWTSFTRLPDVEDDDWLQEFNDDTASAVISETKPVDSKAPLRKRKSEIMGVIKGYADELQKKRKLNTTSSDDDSNRKSYPIHSQWDFIGI